jgi:hypothetical protein
MGCGPEVAGSVYHPRQPQQTPFYQLVERFYPQFEAVYPERYQERYGFWRPIIGTVVRKFLECGDLKHGFARVRCPKCREEFFVPYSCRVRCFCPSCHEKRALEKAGWVAEHVCADAPHRQFVFTIPKRLRIYFRFERRLLGDLCRAAARTVITVHRSASGRPDAVPGVVAAIQTFGQLVHWHPHIHALVSEGVFLPETGAFLPLPKLAIEPFLKLWEQEVFALLLAEGKITDEVVQNIRSWKHSGFSVDQSVRLEPGDQEGVQRLIQYFLRCPFSQARMIEVTEAGKEIYKTEHNAVGRFPEPGDEELAAGPSRNFQVFDPLDFLAEVTQHIPNAGEHLIRYYGWYSNKSRGQRAKTLRSAAAGTGLPAHPPTARAARKGWAALVKQVYEADPLLCPRCGSTMRIIAFIERHQTEVIEKILRHCGLWEERGPPPAPKPTVS